MLLTHTPPLDIRDLNLDFTDYYMRTVKIKENTSPFVVQIMT